MLANILCLLLQYLSLDLFLQLQSPLLLLTLTHLVDLLQIFWLLEVLYALHIYVRSLHHFRLGVHVSHVDVRKQ